MPAFPKKHINDDELKDLVAYIKALRRNKWDQPNCSQIIPDPRSNLFVEAGHELLSILHDTEVLRCFKALTQYPNRQAQPY